MDEDLAALLRNPETPDYVIRDYLLEREGLNVASVYVVVGKCGEYSGKQTWTVAAYLSNEQAESLRVRLEAWCKANGFHDGRPQGYWNLDEDEQERLKPPEDPRFQPDYTGTRYVVEEIPLRVE